MTIKINYKNNISKTDLSNLVLFVDEKFNILDLKKHISNLDYLYILDLLKTKDNKKKILIFHINSKKKITLVSLKKGISNSGIENLGAKFFDISKDFKQNNIILNSDTIPDKLKDYIGYFLHGYRLKSYIFDKYKSKKTKKKYLFLS